MKNHSGLKISFRTESLELPLEIFFLILGASGNPNVEDQQMALQKSKCEFFSQNSNFGRGEFLRGLSLLENTRTKKFDPGIRSQIRG